MNSSGSVTHLIQKLEGRDDAAAHAIWKLYFKRLVGLPAQNLGCAGRGVKDEEDVALSVMDTFCRGLEGGHFPNLKGRDSFWNLLVTLTVRKAQRAIRDEHRQKRSPKQAGVKVLRQADLPAGEEERVLLSNLAGREFDPAFAAQLEEECSRLVKLLDNDTLRAIASLKMAGYTNAEIGVKLGCVERTVKRKLEKMRELWENA